MLTTLLTIIALFYVVTNVIPFILGLFFAVWAVFTWDKP